MPNFIQVDNEKFNVNHIIRVEFREAATGLTDDDTGELFDAPDRLVLLLDELNIVSFGGSMNYEKNRQIVVTGPQARDIFNRL